MNSEEVYIVGCGARTPVGTNAKMSNDMLHVGIKRLLPHPTLVGKDENPIVLGYASYLENDLSPLERMITLGKASLKEALDFIPNQKEVRIACYYTLPYGRDGLPTNLQEETQSQLFIPLQQSFKEMKLQEVQKGYASGFYALQQAKESLLCGESDYCLIGGIDSFFSRGSLYWLENQNRLRSLVQEFGVIPGEAASFTLLTTKEQMEKDQIQPFAQVIEVETIEEQKGVGSSNPNQVCCGEGLGNVFKKVIQKLPPNEKITGVYCNLNGERHRSDEYGFATLRQPKPVFDAGSYRSPLQSMGDVGVAAGSLVLNLVSYANRNQYTSGKWSLAWCSSDSAERGAALLKGC